jgi:hypothetical protein
MVSEHFKQACCFGAHALRARQRNDTSSVSDVQGRVVLGTIRHFPRYRRDVRTTPHVIQEWVMLRTAIVKMLVVRLHAANVIQRAWRKCVADPQYLVARNRLMREFNELTS